MKNIFAFLEILIFSYFVDIILLAAQLLYNNGLSVSQSLTQFNFDFSFNGYCGDVEKVDFTDYLKIPAKSKHYTFTFIFN